MEFSFCWSHSVESISETIRDRGNLLNYYRKFSAQSIDEKKIYIPSNMHNFRNVAPFRKKKVQNLKFPPFMSKTAIVTSQHHALFSKRFSWGIHYTKIWWEISSPYTNETSIFAPLGLLFKKHVGLQYPKSKQTFILCQGSLSKKFRRICQLQQKLSHRNHSVYRGQMMTPT